MTIQIEIDNEGYDPIRFWRIRVGDIAGSIECSNISKEAVLKEVSDAIDELAVERKSQDCKNCGHWSGSHYPKDKIECHVSGCNCKKLEITAKTDEGKGK